MKTFIIQNKMEQIENKEKTRICEYGLVMESCRQCLFETLCRLKKFNSKDE